MAVDPIPKSHHSLTPFLIVPGAAHLIDFLKQAFGAVELGRMQSPDGRVLHAQVKIGDSIVMLGETMTGGPAVPARLYHYVEDVDATYQRALKAGATSLHGPTNQFYGDRRADVTDPAGNVWCIATHVKDVSIEELERVARAMSTAPATG